MALVRSNLSAMLAWSLLAGCARFAGDDPPADAGHAVDASDVDVGVDAGIPDATELEASPGPDAAGPCNGNPDCVRYVFVSAEAIKGNFVTVVAADERCSIDAMKSPKLVGRRFLAWVSSTFEGISPAKRFARGTLPYIRMDGVVIADNWEQFASDLHKAPINHDVFDDQWNGKVWTGTKADGLPSANICLSWRPESMLHVAMSGETTKTDLAWTESGADICLTALHRFYCVEQ